MSKEIDERVVSMQFDNRNFENNVKTTMSTLDKLKHALKLDGASKGLENVSTATKNFDVSPMSRGIEAVSAKFSALQVMGVTALANITNSAVNAGKNIVRAFTITPISTGFSEYELKMNSVQTIMASTGESLEVVNKYLQELNEYSDQTIYSFSDMTQNIGKFTNAGVKLEDAVLAMKGISNEAALSGANANEASRAMYNLAQSLSMGFVQYIDWKSIENANMATMGFKEEILKTAVALKVIKKTSDGYTTSTGKAYNMQAMFKDGMKDQWLTSEVLIKTLKNYADETTEIGKKASQAATEVKTFSMMMDTLKEAAQSGWAQTWELVFGDFNQGKALWTRLSDTFGDIISKSTEARNSVLSGALGAQTSKWDEWIGKLKDAGLSTEQFQAALIETAKEHGIALDDMIKEEGSLVKALKKVNNAKEIVVETLNKFNMGAYRLSDSTGEMTGKLEEFQKVVKDVIRGDFGNGEDRIKALTEAGYNSIVVQKLVNKIWERNGHTWDDCSISAEELSEAIQGMSDAELESIGFTSQQIGKIRTLSSEMNKMSAEEFLAALEKPSGRELLIDSLYNTLDAIKIAIEAVKKAWVDVFPTKSLEEKQEILYNIIDSVHKFTEWLKMSDGVSNDVTRTLRGLFAALDIIRMVLGVGLKFALNVVSGFLEAFGLSALDVTAYIGDLIYKFRNWVKENDAIVKGAKALGAGIAAVVKKISEWITALSKIPQVAAVIDKIKESFEKLKEVDLREVGKNIIDTLRNIDLKEIGSFVIQGFQNGLGEGLVAIPKTMVEMCKKLLQAICDVLDINSPAKEPEKLGSYAAEGFFNGIVEWFKKIFDAGKELGGKIIEGLASFDWEKIFSAMVGVGLMFLVKKIIDVVSTISSPLEGLGELFGGLGKVMDKSAKPIAKVIKNFAGIEKAISFKITASAVLDIALAIGGLAAGLIALAHVPAKNLWSAVGSIAVLGLVLGGLVLAMSKLAKVSGDENKIDLSFAKIGLMVASLGVTLLLMATALKILGTMEIGQYIQGIIGIGILMTGIIVLFKILGEAFDGRNAKNIYKVGKMLLEMSAALLIMVVVCKLAGRLSPTDFENGVLVLGGLLVMILAIAVIAQVTKEKEIAQIGDMILKISLALVLMILVCKLAGKLEWGEMGKGAAIAGGFLVFVLALVAITKITKEQEIAQIGSMVLALSAALVVMILVCKLAGKLSLPDIGKGALVAVMFTAMLVAIIAISKLGDKQTMGKVAGTILALSVAVAIMAAVVVMLGMVSAENLTKGTIVVGFLSAFMAGMLAASKLAENSMGSIISMSIAVAIMAAAIGALSFISLEKLTPATIALGVLMALFSGMAASSKLAKDSMGALIAMAVVIGLFGAALYLLSTLPVESVIGSAIALGAMMLTLSAILLILKFVGNSATSALKGVLLLTAMALPLFLFVGVLGAMQDVKNAEQNVKALVSLALALIILLIPLALVGLMIGPAIMGVLALTAMAFPMLAFIGVLAVMQCISNAQANVELLLTLMRSLTDMLVQVALVGPLALVGVGALNALSGLILVLGAVAVGIGALMDTFPELKTFLDSGLPVLEQIAGSLGTMVGKFVDGLLTAATENLPELGSRLSEFMQNAMFFIAGSKLVDEKTLAGVGILAAAIIALTAADLIDGVASFLTGGSSFADLGKKLSEFMFYALPFIAAANLIDESAMNGVKKMVEVIMLITAAELLSGITSFITGSSSFETFGTQLDAFADAIISFSNKLKENGGIEEDAINAAANAGQIIASLYDALPKTGGWVQGIFGETMSLETFGDQLSAFGDAIIEFSNKLRDNGGIEAEAIEAATNAGKTIAGLYEALPKTDGWAQGIFGETMSFTTFGEQMGSFADAIIGFSNKIKENGGIDSNAVEAAVSAGEIIASLYDVIPTGGGWVQAIMGEQDLTDFADDMTAFAEAVVAFSNTIKDNGGISLMAVSTATLAGKIIASLYDSLPSTEGLWDKICGFFGGGTMTMEEFGEQLCEFGKVICDFAETTEDISGVDLGLIGSSMSRIITLITDLVGLDTSGIEPFEEAMESLLECHLDELANGVDAESLDAITTEISQMTTMFNNMNGIDSNGVIAFKEALDELGTTEINNLVEAFSGAASRLTEAGVDMMNGLITGVDAQEPVLTAAIYDTLNACLAYVSKTDETYRNAGIKLMTTFGEGVSSASEGVYELIATAVFRLSLAAKDESAKFKVAGIAMMTNLNDGINHGFTVVNETIKTLISGIATLIGTSKEKFYELSADLMQYMIDGLYSKYEGMKTATSTMINSVILLAKLNYVDFYSAGEYLGDGLIDGIDSKQEEAYNAGYALGQAAVQGEKDGQESNSPSKLTIKAGGWLGEGLVIGIERMGKSVYKAGSRMGENAVNSISNALNSVNDVVGTGLDLEPTIRPVIDMSSVRTTSLQLNADVSSVLSRPVSSMSQIMADTQDQINASNGRVVDAVNGLREDLTSLYETDDKEIALYMDSKKVASTMAKSMDRQLNILAQRRAY